ncbi:MAG: hypothetical protein ACWGQW_21655 [bacterium]
MISQIVPADDYFLHLEWDSSVGTLMQFKPIPVWALNDGEVVPMVFDFQDDHLIPAKEWMNRFTNLDGVCNVTCNIVSTFEMEIVDEEEEAEWGGDGSC